MEKTKKYLGNTDSAQSRLHLNPYFFGDMWCQLDQLKCADQGGKVYLTSEEAHKVLHDEIPIVYEGKEYKNVKPCINCSKRCRQSQYWDI